MAGTDQPVTVAADDERLESLAEFAAGAGHELNNPVATIVGRVQLLMSNESDPARRQALATIAGQAYRIRDMIADVMLFARPPVCEPQDGDLVEAVDEVIRGVVDGHSDREGRVVRSGEGPVPIHADPTQLAVVIGELVTNALEADREGGRVDVVVTAGDPAVLEVRDAGPGLDEIERRHLFDPFFSGRQAGRGLGFGLPKCWRIVTLHGGRIEAETLEPTGLSVRVSWPSTN